MANAIQITLVGNIGGGDPELRFTPSGAPVAKFRMAQTERYLDRNSNEWKDKEPVWLTVTVWREQAENVVETLRNGDAVIVQGRLGSRTYEDKEGQKRTVFEVEADVVGASLARATAVITKKGRSGGGSSGQRGDDAWEGASTSRPQGQQQTQQQRQQAPAQAANPPSDDW